MCSLVVKERPAQGRTVLVLAVLKGITGEGSMNQN